MPTEQLLRQTLAELADTAPHPTRIRLGAPPPRPRPRWVLLTALVAVAVLAVLVPLVVTRTTAEPADRRAPGYWRMISRVEPPAGWRVVQRTIGGASEATRLRRDADPATDSGAGCQVIVYGRDRAPADLDEGGEPVTVAGDPGIWVAAAEPQPARLVWAYAEGAYAMVTCSDQATRAEHEALAAATRFDQTSDLRLPFRLTALPDGYQVRNVVEFEGPDGLDGGLQTTAGDDGAPPFDVGVARQAFDPPGPGLPGVEQLQVRGLAATVREDRRAVQLTVGSRFPTVTSYGGSDTQSWLPGERDRVVQVAGELRFASDLDDPGTWFSADRAVP